MGSLALSSVINGIIFMLRTLTQAFNKINCGESLCQDCYIRGFIDYSGNVSLAYMSISGDNFTVSSRNGFLINLKYCSKYYFSKKVTKFFIFRGIIFISLLNVFLYSRALSALGDVVYNEVLVFIGIASLIVCFTNLGIYQWAITATLLCLAVDMDLNGEKPYFGPPKFHEKM